MVQIRHSQNDLKVVDDDKEVHPRKVESAETDVLSQRSKPQFMAFSASDNDKTSFMSS